MIKAISFNQLKSRVSYEILNSKNSMNVFVKLKENILKNNRGIQVEIIDVIKTTINTWLLDIYAIITSILVPSSIG